MMSISFGTICLVAIFLSISIGYLLTMRSIFRINYKARQIRNAVAHVDRKPPFSHIQWEVREKIAKAVIENSRSKFSSWASENKCTLYAQDPKVYFEMKVNAFLENVHTRSDLDIPPFFASILGMDELQRVIVTYEKEIIASSISVTMGASCLFGRRKNP